MCSGDDELLLQWALLTQLRVSAVGRMAGLDPAVATATPLPASPVMSLAGVVKHLTAMERFWLSNVGGGANLPSLSDPDDADAEWRIGAGQTPDSLVTAYRAEWWNSEESMDGKEAGDLAAVAVDGRRHTVRWLLNHVIQETARHLGHMDLLRALTGRPPAE